MRQIDCQCAKIDEDSAHESISDTENWLNWNGDLDNPNDSKDDCEADNESEIELENGVKETETPEQWNVSATPNVPELIQSTWRSKKIVERVLMMVWRKSRIRRSRCSIHKKLPKWGFRFEEHREGVAPAR
jgi:hypothetical protein